MSERGVQSESGSPTTDVPGLAGGRVLLASRSPRRTELLTGAGISHEARHPGFDDAVLEPGVVTPAQWVAALAYLKAWSMWRSGTCTGFDVVLGADTACVLDGRMIGTPRDAAEARGMIEGFLDREHEVVTGVALIDVRTGTRRVFAERARVRMGHVDEEEIARYIATDLWKGKAGAYNLEERVRAGWALAWDGDPGTVMGLPIQRVSRMLREGWKGNT